MQSGLEKMNAEWEGTTQDTQENLIQGKRLEMYEKHFP